MLSPASVVVTARIEGACNGNVKQANAMLASIKHIVLEASPPPPLFHCTGRPNAHSKFCACLSMNCVPPRKGALLVTVRVTQFVSKLGIPG